MPLQTVMDLNFNAANYPLGAPINENTPLEAALNWWSVFNGGAVNDTLGSHLSPETMGLPTYVASGANSHLKFSFSPRELGPADEVAGAYSLRDPWPGVAGRSLSEDLTPALGTRVNCFDPDPAKRGVYERAGAGWTRISPTIYDVAWTDYNHPQRLLELLLCSWVYSATPAAFQGGNIAYEGIADGNWQNARLIYTVRAKNLRIGPFAKLGLHVQGNVPARQAALEEYLGQAPRYLVPNYIKTDQLLSDALGFAQPGSWGLENDVPVVYDSGWVDWVVDFSLDDNKWKCFGDPGRDPNGRMVNYGSGPVKDVLANLRGNIYVLAHHDEPRDGDQWWSKSSAERVPEFDRTKGDILLKRVQLQKMV